MRESTLATSVRTSGADCFSPLSDVKTPAIGVPPCAKCGGPSFGGVYRDQETAPAACPIYTVEFFCKEDQPPGEDFILASERLFPLWQILRLYTPSKMTLQRLLRDRQIERVVGS